MFLYKNNTYRKKQMENKPNNVVDNLNNKKKYLMYWKNRNFRYNGDILVFDTHTKEETVYDKNNIVKKFPIPPPFSMLGTPFGHYS